MQLVSLFWGLLTPAGFLWLMHPYVTAYCVTERLCRCIVFNLGLKRAVVGWAYKDVLCRRSFINRSLLLSSSACLLKEGQLVLA